MRATAAVVAAMLLASPPQVAAGGGWAGDGWAAWAAHIVAGETRGVPSARLAVACTLTRDVERGWDPWALRDRWYGWSDPTDADLAAVETALAGGCGDVPEFRFVGNLQDLALWRGRGWVGDGPFVLYAGSDGQYVVGVPAGGPAARDGKRAQKDEQGRDMRDGLPGHPGGPPGTGGPVLRRRQARIGNVR